MLQPYSRQFADDEFYLSVEITLGFRQIAVEQTLSLRHEVLWPDLPIEKVKLPEDKFGWHFGAFVDGPSEENDPIAVISLFLDPIPIDDEVPTTSSASAFSSNDLDLLTPSLPSGTTVRFRKFACKPYAGSRDGNGIAQICNGIRQV